MTVKDASRIHYLKMPPEKQKNSLLTEEICKYASYFVSVGKLVRCILNLGCCTVKIDVNAVMGLSPKLFLGSILKI